MNLHLFNCEGDVFVVVAPLINIEIVYACAEQKMKLLEDYYDNNFIYERGSIILKGYFFQETQHNESNAYFHAYQPNVIIYQYSHLVCEMHIKLIEVQ